MGNDLEIATVTSPPPPLPGHFGKTPAQNSNLILIIFHWKICHCDLQGGRGVSHYNFWLWIDCQAFSSNGNSQALFGAHRQDTHTDCDCTRDASGEQRVKIRLVWMVSRWQAQRLSFDYPWVVIRGDLERPNPGIAQHRPLKRACLCEKKNDLETFSKRLSSPRLIQLCTMCFILAPENSIVAAKGILYNWMVRDQLPPHQFTRRSLAECFEWSQHERAIRHLPSKQRKMWWGVWGHKCQQTLALESE